MATVQQRLSTRLFRADTKKMPVLQFKAELSYRLKATSLQVSKLQNQLCLAIGHRDVHWIHLQVDCANTEVVAESVF